MAAAFAAAAFDYEAADTALRPPSERARHLTEAIRFGADIGGVTSNLGWAVAAIRDYLPNGDALARQVEERFWEDATSLPAEALADILVKLGRNDKLFYLARSFEYASFAREIPNFDALDVEEKSLLGSLLDFVSVDRRLFAEAWSAAPQLNLLSAASSDSAKPSRSM